MNKKLSVISRIWAVALCLCLLMGICSAGLMAAADISQVSTYIDKTYEYEKGSGAKILTDTEAKTALTEATDLLMLAAGRDVGRTAVTDAEFETYLGYINANLRSGNGSYKAVDFLRAALAAGASGADPTSVGKDSNGNRVDLLYKGVYSRSLSTLEKAGTETVAYALLALDANEISNGDMKSAGSKVTRAELKGSLVEDAQSLSGESSPNASTAAMILTALAPYYLDNETAVVTAANDLLTRLAVGQAADGSVKDAAATAELIVALCAMGIDPASNSYFSYDLHNGLMVYYNSDGGFAASSGGNSSAAATASARCALVAYSCFLQDGLFFDFSAVKAHSVKSIATTTTTTTNNNTSTTNTNKSTSSSSNTNKSTSSTTKSTSGSSSTTKSTSGSSSTTKSSGTSTTTQSSGTSTASAKTVTKDKFKAIKGTDEVYLYEGTWGEEEPYTLSFNGMDITNPMDFDPSISSVVTHQMEMDAAADVSAEYINFLHEGSFPGKATATITVSLADGSYNCYRYDEAQATFVAVGSVIVANGMVSFDVLTGGEYFVTDSTATVSTEQMEMAVSDTVDGIVPASTFESIQGKNTDLVLTGETDRGVRYEITFNGMEITAPLDFNMRIVEETAYWDEISSLVEGPLVLNFMHSGVLPGPAHVTFFANLDAATTYAIYYFNPSEVCGVYSGTLDVGDGEFSFTLNHCSEYFIAPYTGEDLLTDTSYIWLIILIIVVVILVGCGVVLFILYRRWGKEGFAARVDALKAATIGKLSRKKAPAAEKGDGSAEASAEGEEITEELFTAEESFAEAPSESDAFTEALPVDTAEGTGEIAEEIPSEVTEAPEVTEAAPVERDYASFMRPAEDESSKE